MALKRLQVLFKYNWLADKIPDVVAFSNLRNLSSQNMALGLTQHLTDMSIRNLPGGKARPLAFKEQITLDAITT
jgi:hypothetical protein